MPERPAPLTVFAFDFGLRRIGVAVGQQVTGSASAIATIANGANGPDWASIDRLLDEWRPQCLIVGVPMMPDGRPGSLLPAIEEFCAALERYELPIETIDERLSSSDASARLKASRQAGGRRRIGKAAIDAAAAAVIAERWLAQSA
ncbi:MAG: Holliday junction resolvase RuvX [Woeseia sp.]